MHVLHQIDVPTSDHWRILQHTFWCFLTKSRHAARRMKSFRKGHVTCWMLSIKWDCFLVCFVQNIRYFVGTSAVTTISNDQGNILQTLCKTSLKKTLCNANTWIGTHAMFPMILKWCCHFSVKLFSLRLQHFWCTYRANISDQLIKNSTIVSVDFILSV